MTEPGSFSFCFHTQRLSISYIRAYIHTSRLPCQGFSGPATRTEHNSTVKNFYWLATNQLVIYKCRGEVEPGSTRNECNKWSQRVLNPTSPDPQTTGLHCLPENTEPKISSNLRDSFKGSAEPSNMHECRIICVLTQFDFFASYDYALNSYVFAKCFNSVINPTARRKR